MIISVTAKFEFESPNTYVCGDCDHHKPDDYVRAELCTLFNKYIYKKRVNSKHYTRCAKCYGGEEL